MVSLGLPIAFPVNKKGGMAEEQGNHLVGGHGNLANISIQTGFLKMAYIVIVDMSEGGLCCLYFLSLIEKHYASLKKNTAYFLTKCNFIIFVNILNTLIKGFSEIIYCRMDFAG